MKIPGLDGLRAIAFLLVFALHTDYLQVGWVGVQFFFVLSGFLITNILINMKRTLTVKEYFSKFYGRRFLRIFPLYYFYLLLMTAVTIALLSIAYRPNYMKLFLEQVVYAGFYVYNFFFGTIFFKHSHFLDHFWSLSVEEQFYVFWPLLILLTPERWTKKLFMSFIILGPLFRVFFHFVYHSGVFRFLGNPVSLAIYPLPFSHIDAFAFGAYISCYSIPRAKQQFFVLLWFMPIVGYISQYVATGKIGAVSAFGYPLLLSEAYQYIWGYTLMNYFFAVIVQVMAKEGIFPNFLEWRAMRYLGKISYGLYVYHFPIIWFSARIRDLNLEEVIAKPLTAIVAFFATLLIASLSYHLLEKPILDQKDRLFALTSSVPATKLDKPLELGHT